MIQNLLYDTCPESVLIGGKEYPINYGYRAVMAVEIEMFSDNSDEQKLLNALNLFYFQNIPEDVDAAVDYMLWFHRCGERAETTRKRAGNARRGYDFQQDAPLIYAAFRQQYGINLKHTKNQELHWWEFRAMFESLDENVKMAKVMFWRTCDLRGMSKEQRNFIKKMRSIYALKMPANNMDSRTKLARRNADMKAYVRRRAEECLKKG